MKPIPQIAIPTVSSSPSLADGKLAAMFRDGGLMARFVLLAVAVFALLGPQTATAITPTMKDGMVQVTATATDGPPPSITLNWTTTGTPLASGTSYAINRRIYGDATNVYAYTQIATISGTATTSYTDTAITPGTIYEYQMIRYGDIGNWITDSNTTANTPGIMGYVASGLQVPLRDQRGTVVLLVDTTIAANCTTRLTRLTRDLIGDGWKVIQHNVARDTSDPANNITTSGAIVSAIQSQVRNDYATNPDLSAVLIFGHVAIPFSGLGSPNGHYDRAMGCDGYYGDMDHSWTDTVAYGGGSLTLGPSNDVGDGRWDFLTFTSRKVMTGRIDFAGEPDFTATETQLLNRYLDKDHNYRAGLIVPQRKAFIAASGGNYRNGMRTFDAYFGAANVAEYPNAPWSSIMPAGTKIAPYMWGQSVGSGNYNGVGNMATTVDMAANDYPVLFTYFGASYMADWWHTQSLLRGVLAMPTYSLTSAYSIGAGGTSDYQFDRFAMGFPIGAALQTGTNQYLNDMIQWTDPNNANNYISSGNNQHGVTYGSDPYSSCNTWTTLFGDPTLMMYVVAPPSSFAASRNGSNAVLSWTAVSGTSIQGYNIYRSPDWATPFTKLNATLVSGTTYTDATARTTDVLYMVRAVSYENRGTGLYYNGSQGQFASLPLSGSASQPPTALVVNANTNENVAFTVNLAGTDPNNYPLQSSIVSYPSHGSLVWSGTNMGYTYTPASNYFGTDSFTYTVNNGYTDSAPAAANITINFVGVRPTVGNVSMTAYNYSGVPNEAYLSGTDSNGYPVSFRIVTPPAHGSVSIVGTIPTGTISGTVVSGSSGGIARYTPFDSPPVADSFTYISNNTVIDSASVGTVTITSGTDLIPTANLQAYWKFDSVASGTTPDSGPVGTNGCALVNATIATGTSVLSGSGALRINASTQTCKIPPTITGFYNLNAPNMTASVWFNADNIALTTRNQVIMKMGEGGANGGWSVYIYNSKLYFHTSPSTSFVSDTVLSTAIQSGRWHHLAMTVEANATTRFLDRMSAYLDGTLVGRAPATQFLKLANGSSVSSIGGNLGSYVTIDGSTSNAACWLGGYVDEVRLYTKRLQPTQIRSLYDANNPYPQPPVAVVTSNTASGISPAIITFSGTGSYSLTGTIASYSWAFGDGATGTNSSVNHTYNVSGTSAVTYNAVLTVTDNTGLQSTGTTSSVSIWPTYTTRGTSVQWLMNYFGLITDYTAVENSDPDFDGRPVWANYVAGTNPFDSTDAFAVKGVVRSGQTATVTVAGKAGHSYILDRTLDLVSPSWTSVAQLGSIATNQDVVLIDTAAPSDKAFYRVRVTFP